MANSNHDERGRFASGSNSGAATGDHGKVSPSATTRNVSGHNIPRSKVVTKHGAQASVGTSSGGGGLSGGAGGGGQLSAKQERINMRKAVDERHKPTRTDADVSGMTTLQGTHTAPGKMSPSVNDAAKSVLRNKATNAAMRASSRASPRTQPSAGQLIGAGVITKQ
jgi:hypothetical protein